VVTECGLPLRRIFDLSLVKIQSRAKLRALNGYDSLKNPKSFCHAISREGQWRHRAESRAKKSGEGALPEKGNIPPVPGFAVFRVLGFPVFEHGLKAAGCSAFRCGDYRLQRMSYCEHSVPSKSECHLLTNRSCRLYSDTRLFVSDSASL